MRSAYTPGCEQLLDICATIPGLVYQFKQTPEGTLGFNYVSDGAHSLLGISPEELYNDANFGLGSVHPEDVPAINNSILQSAATLTPWQNVFRVKTGNGAYTKYVRANSLPQKQQDGSVLWNGTMIDITDTITAQNHLLLFQRALEHTSEGIIIVDAQQEDQPIIFVNKAFCDLTGYQQHEVIGRNCRMLQGPASQEETIEAMRRSIENGLPFSGEVLNYKKDRTPFWNYLSINPILNNKGEVTHYVSFQKDVTERKQAEENIQSLNEYLEIKIAERTASLEQANSELEAFSYTVTHDLLSPLRVISGFLKIISNEHQQHLSPDVNNYLKMVDHNVTRMSSLVKHVLAFSRLGKQAIKMGQTNMQSQVESLLSPEFLKALYPQTKVVVKPLPRAWCDAELVGQVWYNLIGNALKYSAKKENPVVEIGAETKDNEVVYYVKDNGAGFSMDYAHKLFGVFQRLHGQDEFEGQGIGLATVHRIITRHGGRIWAEAREGAGATFYFTLAAMHPRAN